MRQKKRWIIQLLATILIAGYLLYMPAYLDDALGVRTYEGKFSKNKEQYTGIITVWHIVGFKPYSGSLSTALSAIAKKVEARHHGVFFNILAMDEAEYAQRIARGERPDVFSFPAGLCYPEQLTELEGVEAECLPEHMKACGEWEGISYALPYAMSAHTCILNTALFQERGAVLPEGERDEAWLLATADAFATAQAASKRKPVAVLAGNAVYAAARGFVGEVAEYDAFRSGKAAMAIADLQAVATLHALQTAGKGFAFEAYVLPGETSLLQMVGMASGIGDEKVPYATELMGRLFTESAQESFVRLGLLAVIGPDAQEKAENALLFEAMEKLRAPVIPNAFLLQRYRDVLQETARRALLGDGAAKKDLDARLKELVSGS